MLHPLTMAGLLTACTTAGSVDDPRFESATLATRSDGHQQLVLTSSSDACDTLTELVLHDESGASYAETWHEQLGAEGWLLSVEPTSSGPLEVGEHYLGFYDQVAIAQLVHTTGRPDGAFFDGYDDPHAQRWVSHNTGSLVVEEVDERRLVGHLRGQLVPFVDFEFDLEAEPEVIDTDLVAVVCEGYAEAFDGPDADPPAVGTNVRDPTCDQSAGSWCGCELVGAAPEADPDQIVGETHDPTGSRLLMGMNTTDGGFCAQLDLLSAAGDHERHAMPESGARGRNYLLELTRTGTYEPGLTTALAEGEDFSWRVSLWTPEGSLVDCHRYGPLATRFDGLPLSCEFP